MITTADLDEYLTEVREQVCRHCIERPPGGPPCGPLGKACAIELHLAELIDICHRVDSQRIDPYVDHFHDEICTVCANRPTPQCPCALSYLIPLAISAIETVDLRRAERAAVSRQRPR